MGQTWPGRSPGQHLSSSSAMATFWQQNVSGAAATFAIWHSSQAPIIHDRRRRTGDMDTISIALSICLLTTGLVGQVQAAQQDEQPAHDHMTAPAPDNGWTWTTDASIFAGYNYQQRLFADFAAIESQ